MKSILQSDKECWFCHSPNVELHHIYFGRNRKISDKMGFTVWLCPEHHRGTRGIHGMFGNIADEYLKQLCQEKFEETHSREEFIKLIGRSYL